MTYEDDIALLADDIRRYCNNDGRIDEALTQLLKLHQAEVDALAFEARSLDRMVTRMEGAHTDNVIRACELCDQPFDGEGVCSRHEPNGLYGDWRSDCG